MLLSSKISIFHVGFKWTFQSFLKVKLKSIGKFQKLLDSSNLPSLFFVHILNLSTNQFIFTSQLTFIRTRTHNLWTTATCDFQATHGEKKYSSIMSSRFSIRRNWYFEFNFSCFFRW